MRLPIVKQLVVTLTALIATVGLASSAVAAEPTGEYSVFKECPLSVPDINSCVYSLTTSGEVTLGNNTTPITKSIVFQGGETREVTLKEIVVEGREGPEIEYEEEEIRKFVPAANGETLVKSPQPVPGGLAGLIECDKINEPVAKLSCELVFQNGLTGVNATTELVGEANFSFAKLASKEVGLVMPVRVHLENPFLGSACYIGSASEPIDLKLTTGTTSPPPPNEPITGSPGEAEIRNGGKLVIAHNDSAVDNSFSVPGAKGCGGLLAAVLDPVIDLKLGLPSPAGKNKAILNGTLEQASSGAVEESEL